MSRPRTIAWFSCGVASAVATKLALAKNPELIPVYCETHSEHLDNERFIKSCEKWFGKKIRRISSDRYSDTWDVWKKRNYLAGINGAPCTVEMKVIPRLIFQLPNDIHVFGYTNDPSDKNRAIRLRENYPELKILTPLIKRKVTKAACLALIERARIEVPAMYRLGFLNNNCIPCVKATSPAYWALVRKHFPREFAKMSRLSRRLNVKLCRMAGKRKFIDQIPQDQNMKEPIAPSCDFLCHLAEASYS